MTHNTIEDDTSVLELTLEDRLFDGDVHTRGYSIRNMIPIATILTFFRTKWGVT